MKNYKEELTSLKEELNSRIDDVIAKIENSKFELNKWYVLNCDWCFLVNISKIEDNNIFGYGFNYYGTRNEYIENPENSWVDIKSLYSYHLATQKEVEEALKIEYYKRGYERGKWIDLDRKDVTNTCSLINIKFIFKEESNELWVQGCGIVFHNGKWAEIIKTKTIDELAFLFKEKYNRSPKNLLDFYKEFSLENKQTIIETLNNL